ncbi:hypothetical protein AVEN_57556-1 [Araneus ventricosus]|uniref:Uncharacterized protein n=1 Tax=Araneus ventricosus TaxID=182803 RepID=A0A4Y2TR54_ARAVE|nr:hypothetical protein AVEN_19368-1 [Araneus ventricosus]GBO02367.1 hypothetical protein AVEN_66669-1 [Araneus ventricosus]GBO02732.1 hypothetical protein AVEN_225953-1 [Araneus ventricosus]GBO02827.1 hypothetical protein AVEN_57556-1 [Araneus ventricosus]
MATPHGILLALNEDHGITGMGDGKAGHGSLGMGESRTPEQLKAGHRHATLDKQTRTCRWRFLGTAGWQAFAQDGT